jgi:molybdopterin synthase sulfur carrier subunit
MPLLFVIPGAVRPFAGDRPEIRVPFGGGSLAQALEALWDAAPALRDRVLTELDEVRPHLNVFVDGLNARDIGGMTARVEPDAEIVLLPAVSGGSS